MLPFTFDYAASNVVLDASGDFLLEAALSVRRTNWQLPEYRLDVQGLQQALLRPAARRRQRQRRADVHRVDAHVERRARQRAVDVDHHHAGEGRQRGAGEGVDGGGGDLKFGAQVGASYLPGLGRIELLARVARHRRTCRTGTGPAEVFARLGLPEVSGLYAKASGTSTKIDDAQMTLVTTQKAEVVLEAPGTRGPSSSRIWASGPVPKKKRAPPSRRWQPSNGFAGGASRI